MEATGTTIAARLRVKSSRAHKKEVGPIYVDAIMATLLVARLLLGFRFAFSFCGSLLLSVIFPVAQVAHFGGYSKSVSGCSTTPY